MCKKPPERRKVGDTLTVTVAPADAKVTYQWLADGEDILGEDDATLFVDEDLIGSKISVEVTDEDGNTAVSDETARVTADKSEDVKIVDVMGLQSDGTAIIGDRLSISYGASFGTPTAISWYKDGAVVATYSVGDTVRTGLNFDVTPAAGAGTYKATVVADGITYETNEILVTTTEEQAEILDFDIEDDYTDGNDIRYNATDTRAVATVTLSKNYSGNIQIWKKSDSKYSGAIDNLNTNTNAVPLWITSTSIRNGAASVTPVVAAPGDGASVLSGDQPTNYTIENLTAGSGIGHINADGTVTYKFVVNAGLTRGTDYVVTFDQASIVGDTPGTGTANVFDEAVTAPYVEAPAAIAVTKISNGNAPEITFQDASGATLQWLGKAGRTAVAATSTVRAATNTLALAGFDTAAVYANTVKANDPTASTVTALAPGITTANTVLSGVWTGGQTATNTAYWFAKVTAPAGIYGKDALTLVSPAADVAQDAATMMNLVEDKTTATSAVVSFSNLRCDGTVYIVRGASYGATNTDYISTAANIYAGYNAVGAELVTASAPVTKGAEKVTVANAIGKYTGVIATGAAGQTVNGDNYIAVFIPDDEDNYGRIYTDNVSAATGLVTIFNANTKVNGAADGGADDDSCGVQITQAATSLKYDANGATTVTAKDANTITIKSTNVIAYDQFGEKVVTTKALTGVTSVTATDKTITNQERGTAKYAVNDTGEITGVTTVDLTVAGPTDKDDGYTISVLGSDLTVMNKSAGAIAAGAFAGYEIKLGSNTLLSAAGTAAAAQQAAVQALTAATIQSAAIVDANAGKTFADEVATIKANVLANIQGADTALAGVAASDLTFSAWQFPAGTDVTEATTTALTNVGQNATYTVTVNYAGETKVLAGCTTALSDGDA